MIGRAACLAVLTLVVAPAAGVAAGGPGLAPGWPITGVPSTLLLASDGTLQIPLQGGRTAILNRDGTRRRIVAWAPNGANGLVYDWANPEASVSASTPAGGVLWRSPPLFLGPEASYGDLREDAAGNVYAAGEWGMVALDPAGRIRWREQWTSDARGTFALAPDGILYLAYAPDGAGALEARGPDGRTLWRRPLGGIGRRLDVGRDGTVVVAQTSPGGAALRSFTPEGTERWVLPTDHLALWMASAADGTLYLATPADIRGAKVVDPGLVSAVGPDGVPRWTYRGGPIAMADPIVGGDGTVHVGGSPLVALHPDGTRAWSFPPTAWPLVPTLIGTDGTLYATGGGAWFALPGPSARMRVAPPTPEGQRALIAGLSLRPTRFRMRGPASLCPVPGGPCRPATSLGATLSFTLRRDATVSVVIRRPSSGAIVTRRTWRARLGTTWSGLWDAANHRTLAPGRYALTVRAARGAARVTAGPVRFRVVG